MKSRPYHSEQAFAGCFLEVFVIGSCSFSGPGAVQLLQFGPRNFAMAGHWVRRLPQFMFFDNAGTCNLGSIALTNHDLFCPMIWAGFVELLWKN